MDVYLVQLPRYMYWHLEVQKAYEYERVKAKDDLGRHSAKRLDVKLKFLSPSQERSKWCAELVKQGRYQYENGCTEQSPPIY